MEKKGSQRNVQNSLKGYGTDSKKNQDVLCGKVWPRGGRRREPAGGQFPSKPETSRKPTPQRNRTLDKRPKPRGGAYCAPSAGNEGTRLTEDCGEEPELGSVFVPGSKKQSLNHLLNFHYAPRESQPRNVTAAKGHRLLTTGKHKYNKEHFIQANCQFVVNSSGDYKQYMNNPDALVDWSLIEQVNVQVHELPTCPICLYPPVAAKMTRCGHIYCWSCVLHYLALSDKTSRKCPICYESIHRQDLKSVVPIPHSSFNVNETITFKLMKRTRGSLIAYPFDQHIKESDTIFNMSDPEASDIHCKLLIAEKADIMSIIEREKFDLKEQLSQEDNLPESCFIQEAITSLKERENVILENVEDAKQYIPSEDSIKIEESGTSVPTKVFYFYQARDGQHIYLHAINVRMLEHTYGSLEFCPKILTGRIIEKEGGSMTEELRNRLRYLQHLPVTCQFEVAEIHLPSSVISKETIEFFKEQLETRKKRRQRRSRDEKRREKRISEEENRQMGKYPVADIQIESHFQFPEFGSEADKKERTISESTSRSLSPASVRTNESIAGSLTMEHEFSGPSFARMLSNTTKKSWPELKGGQNASPVSAAKLINVTGSKLQTLKIKNASESEPECEDYVPAPEYNRSFSDAIAMALEKASKSNNDGNNGEGKCGKKKKKNKQKILFATSMAYGGN